MCVMKSEMGNVIKEYTILNDSGKQWKCDLCETPLKLKKQLLKCKNNID